ncbi:MAG TPA: cyclodeaminase/cyclohydrolase family protein [Chloroflexota bacterium]|nr:cyclodeaminase/cyclohydrolase family protein [Chloroflexota bacterium]
MDLSSLTIDEFLERLGSSDPTPGGGSLAALAGAMAAAMLAMVCNLTVGHARYADVEPEVRSLLDRARAIQQRLLALANADVDAYESVRDAYRLPRGAEDERARRAAAIERSMIRATEVPVDTAEAAREIVDLARRAADITNANALGDVVVAGHLAAAAVHGAAAQARLNLATISDSSFVERIRDRVARLTDDMDARVADMMAAIDRRADG